MRKTIDAELGLELAGGNQELAAELLAMLLRDLRQFRAQLIQAAETDAQGALLEHAHRLNGSSRYCGVPALTAAAERLEQEIKAVPSGGTIAAHLDQVVREIDRLLSHDTST